MLAIDTSSAKQKFVAIDQDRLMFRLDLNHIGWNAADWNDVAAHDPFGREPVEKNAARITRLAGVPRPVLRADWFTFVVLQPPLYHRVLKLPNTLEELDKHFGVDRFAAIKEGRVARSGMRDSRVQALIGCWNVLKEKTVLFTCLMTSVPISVMQTFRKTHSVQLGSMFLQTVNSNMPAAKQSSFEKWIPGVSAIRRRRKSNRCGTEFHRQRSDNAAD